MFDVVYDGRGGAEFLLPEVRQARDAALALVESAASDGDRSRIDQAIRTANLQNRPWSANLIRDWVPDVRSSLIGSRVLAASKRGEMVRVGDEPSTSVSTHGHRIALWQPTGGVKHV